jgi:putative ABC transport system permease protein
MKLWRGSIRRLKREDELDEEIQSHLRLAAEERAEQGETAEQARAAATREFGNVPLVKEVTRDMWGYRWLETLLQDVRYGLRMLVKNPGFTAVAVLTLALGIGANTAIFSVLDAVLLRPLPYRDSQQLVKVWTRFTGIGAPNDQNWVSAPEFRDFVQLNKSFADLAAISGDTAAIGVKGSPERVVGAEVSPSLFPILGVRAHLGRTFLPEEAQPGHEQEVVLSYGLWQRAYGGDSGIIGRTIRANDIPMTVVGVMPPGFAYPDEAEIWAPLAFGPDDLAPDNRGNHGLEVLGRIKPGLTLAQVQADMDRVARTMIEQNGDYPYQKYGFGVILHPLLEETVGDAKAPLWVLMAAVALVLLIACANVASLLLVRASGRQKETAVRMALGAGPGRLTRQLLTESILLAVVGGGAGLAITPWVLRGLVTLGASALPRVVSTGIDVWALGFTLAVAIACGILFGMAPALQVRRGGSYEVLKEGGRTSLGTPTGRLRHLLVVGEAALSLILLAGAGLLLRSFVRVLQVDPGFRPEGVLTMRISLPHVKYSKNEQVRAFYRDLLDRIQGLPGVQAAGAVSALPLSGEGNSGTVTVDTHAVPLEETTPEVDYRSVTPGYFKAMGISLVQGRYFTDSDSESAAPVAIIDESMAETYWPGQDAIGKRLKLGDRMSKLPWMTIAGVVRHVHNRTLEARSRVELYWPHTQNPYAYSSMGLAIRTSGDPMALADTVRKLVLEVDSEQPVYEVRTMTELMGDSVARRRLAMILMVVFACLALGLASIGIYGVTSYSVTQRQQEIGLRMALGAQRGQVLRMVIGQGMTLTLAGLGGGLLASLILMRLMRGLLFAVSPSDPVVLGGATLLLAGVALFACYLPARRATKVDPMEALRYE